MCRWCGDTDCSNGTLCHLGPYIVHHDFQAAVRRVQALDSSFTARSLGSQLCRLRTHGGIRPANVSGVWTHFQRIGDAGYTCPYCQRALVGGYHVDHIVPWQAYIRNVLGLDADAEGSLPAFVARVLTSDPANLHLVCASCNESKGDMEESDPRFPAWLAQRRAWGAQQQPQQPRQPAGGGTLPPWRQARLQRHQARMRSIWGEED